MLRGSGTTGRFRAGGLFIDVNETIDDLSIAAVPQTAACLIVHTDGNPTVNTITTDSITITGHITLTAQNNAALRATGSNTCPP